MGGIRLKLLFCFDKPIHVLEYELGLHAAPVFLQNFLRYAVNRKNDGLKAGSDELLDVERQRQV
jgi:hypothetical protein